MENLSGRVGPAIYTHVEAADKRFRKIRMSETISSHTPNFEGSMTALDHFQSMWLTEKAIMEDEVKILSLEARQLEEGNRRYEAMLRQLSQKNDEMERMIARLSRNTPADIVPSSRLSSEELRSEYGSPSTFQGSKTRRSSTPSPPRRNPMATLSASPEILVPNIKSPEHVRKRSVSENEGLDIIAHLSI